MTYHFIYCIAHINGSEYLLIRQCKAIEDHVDCLSSISIEFRSDDVTCGNQGILRVVQVFIETATDECYIRSYDRIENYMAPVNHLELEDS